MELDQLRSNCRHFTGYRPCKHGCECEGCRHFSPDGPSVLILKMNQLGNIVKTTPILHALRKKYENPSLCWMASPAGCKLLANSPLIDEVLTTNADDLLYCQVRKWDLVLGLEADRQVAAIATSMNAAKKFGFGLNEHAKLWPLGPESEYLYSLNLSNQVRFRENRRAYHELYFDMLGVPYEGEEYEIHPAEQDFAYADHLLRSLDLVHDGPIVGLNTGGNAARFETKQWTIDGFVHLARMLHQQLNAKVVLLGGPAEGARNAEILSRTRDCAVDSGCDHSILQFCAFLARLSCVVSGDAFGLQAAVAVKTPTVGIFGPTPPGEIAMFGRGRKVVTDLDCSPCYLRNASDCPRGADCMERITVEEVFAATAELLGNWATG